MKSPYGLEIIESCVTCELRADRLFCNLSLPVLQAFEAIKYATVYPKGAMLFVEGQSPRGIFVMCNGRVKLSTCSSDGKTIITQIAGPGEVIGLSATISGRAYEVTAETLAPCQVNFVRREDFLRFLAENSEAALRVATHLSNYYHIAYEQVRSLGLARSAPAKLAKLLLEWCDGDGKMTDQGIRLKVLLTHEEIAQMIGSSRETVTRMLAELRAREIIEQKGSSLFVRDRSALESLVGA
jgi:CRP/FNR family transcriptional regulator